MVLLWTELRKLEDFTDCKKLKCMVCYNLRCLSQTDKEKRYGGKVT